MLSLFICDNKEELKEINKYKITRFHEIIMIMIITIIYFKISAHKG